MGKWKVDHLAAGRDGTPAEVAAKQHPKRKSQRQTNKTSAMIQQVIVTRALLHHVTCLAAFTCHVSSARGALLPPSRQMQPATERMTFNLLTSFNYAGSFIGAATVTTVKFRISQM